MSASASPNTRNSSVASAGSGVGWYAGSATNALHPEARAASSSGDPQVEPALPGAKVVLHRIPSHGSTTLHLRRRGARWPTWEDNAVVPGLDDHWLDARLPQRAPLMAQLPTAYGFKVEHPHCFVSTGTLAFANRPPVGPIEDLQSFAAAHLRVKGHAGHTKKSPWSNSLHGLESRL